MAQMVCMPILYARPLYFVATLTLILKSTLKRGNSHLYPMRGFNFWHALRHSKKIRKHCLSLCFLLTCYPDFCLSFAIYCNALELYIFEGSEISLLLFHPPGWRMKAQHRPIFFQGSKWTTLMSHSWHMESNLKKLRVFLTQKGDF